MNTSVPSKHEVVWRFYRLASVSVIANMMVPLAGMVDTAFLGHLQNIGHLGGVILASILFDYIYRVLKFLRSSTNAIAAQYSELDDPKLLLLAGLRSGAVALAIGLLTLLLQIPIQKIGFSILGGSPDIETYGVEYFSSRILGAPAVLLNLVLFGWFLAREMNLVVLIMSIVSNGANVLLDYLMIVKWDWASTGAGLATSISHYLALTIGLVWAASSISWSTVPAAFKEVFDWAAIKDILAFNSSILIRYVTLVSTYAVFTNLSAVMGTDILAENGLLIQIVFLSQFTVQGVGLTVQTLTGNFKSKGITEYMGFLLMISLFTALAIALSFASVSILYSQQVFGLLTNHLEISQNITNYTIWLFPVLVITAIAFILEGYFIGLKEGLILRNAVLLAFIVGFIPLAIAAWYYHSNHLLWGTIISYMATIALVLAIQVPQTFTSTTTTKTPVSNGS